MYTSSQLSGSQGVNSHSIRDPLRPASEPKVLRLIASFAIHCWAILLFWHGDFFKCYIDSAMLRQPCSVVRGIVSCWSCHQTLSANFCRGMFLLSLLYEISRHINGYKPPVTKFNFTRFFVVQTVGNGLMACPDLQGCFIISWVII